MRTQADQAVDPNAPLRLSVAAELAFPGGGMTASGLRREAAKGRLAVERIAGKDFTTLAAIEEMRTKCLHMPKEPVSGSDRQRVREPQSGASKTATIELALASANETVNRLSGRSPVTSPRDTVRKRKARVLRPNFPKFQSPTS